MHILYFHQHFSTPQGATGTRSYEMARRLVARGHRVTMVCGSYSAAYTGLTGPFVRGRRTGEVDGIRVIELELPYANKDSFARRSVSFARFALRSVGIALTHSYDLVFATTTPLTAGIPGIAARALRGRPFVFEVRDLWPELPKAMGVISNPLVLGALSLLEWLSYHAATASIGLAPGIVDGIAARGIDEARITMIPNGCDLELFAPEAHHVGAPDLPGSIRAGDLVAAFTGAHGVANGLDAVLDAAAEIKRRGRSDIRFLFVGEGRVKPALQDRVTAEQLPVDFLDPMPKERLAALFARVDVGLMVLANVPAFYHGTSPNKFFDYIAAGLPVLNNYPGWLAELIVEHECGLAIPADDPLSFADALETLADDRRSLETMGRHGRALAEAEFDREMLAERFVSFLEQAARR
jgi:glycosyltransferase involved in cell wall biosynthesis